MTVVRPELSLVVPLYNEAGWGRSHVRLGTLLEFVWNMLRYRLGGH